MAATKRAKKEAVEPTTVEVLVIGMANNAGFIYGSLDGNRIAIRIPRRINADQLLKKFITITITHENNTPTYTYGN